MTRTAWMFTLGSIWGSQHATRVVCTGFATVFFGYAFWSWYREAKHKEEVHV